MILKPPGETGLLWFIDSNGAYAKFEYVRIGKESTRYLIVSNDHKTCIELPDDNIEKYTFAVEDPDYKFFDRPVYYNNEHHSVSFRLVCENEPDLFLQLMNEHNGRNSHMLMYKLSETLNGVIEL